MAASVLLFDLDGTLVDSNAAHAEAFARAAADFGVPIAQDRFDREIGKGADHVVPDVFGETFEAEHGEAFRERTGEHFRAIAAERSFDVFDGAEKLVRLAKRRGLKTALATSSSQEDLDALFESAGVDFRSQVHFVTTASDVDESKPAPDLVTVGAEHFGVPPSACVLIGDTIYDGQAARRAGAAFIGIPSWIWSADDLIEVGSRFRGWRLSDLINDVPFTSDAFGPHMETVTPGDPPLTSEIADALMESALTEARAALDAGDGPVGAVVAQADGTILTRGRNRAHSEGNALRHAELEALNALAASEVDAKGLILVTTLEPCAMCFGAATEARIHAVLYALEAPPNGAADALHPITTPDLSLIHPWVGADEVHRSAALDLVREASTREGVGGGYFFSLSSIWLNERLRPRAS